MSKVTRKPRILFYDIETTPLLVYVWRLGEQVVRHHQLAKRGYRYGIICISYAWNDNKPPKVIHWDYDKQDSGRVIREFDKIIKQADISIGKNSDRFDVKHINTQRLLHNLPPLPEWMDYTDDLEKQIRKHFIFPSFGQMSHTRYRCLLLYFFGKIVNNIFNQNCRFINPSLNVLKNDHDICHL